jgi:hypothetical protein
MRAPVRWSTVQAARDAIERWAPDMDVSERILRIWMSAIHAGMTEICILTGCGRA